MLRHFCSSWGLPPQEVCSCSERYQGVTAPRSDLLKVKAPYVTYLCKEKDTGERGDGDGCRKGTEMGREKKIGFQTNVLLVYNLGFVFIQLKFSPCSSAGQFKEEN